MSKYIKLDDAIHNINLEVTGRKEYTGDMKANLFFALDDLPTIEVSEDVLYIPLNNQTVKRINRLHKDECGEYFDEEWLFNELEQIAEFREVSEGIIGQGSGDIDWQAVTSTGQEIYAKGYEDGRKSVEVSEDCISREYLKSFEYINKGDFNSVETIREWIDTAPSVVPTTEQSSKVGEWIWTNERKSQHKCSHCGEVAFAWYSELEDMVEELFDYCPWCGAKMKRSDQ